MKKMMDKGDPAPGDSDMASEAKLKVLGHLKKMASDMMSKDVSEGWAKRSNKDAAAEKSDYNMSGVSKPQNDGSADSQGIDDHDGDEEASVAEQNSMDNEQTAQDFNEEHTHESLDAEIARLHEMRRRLSDKD